MNDGPIYAVVLVLAEEGAARVRAVWERLAAAGMQAPPEGIAPHVTLGAFGQVDLAVMVTAMAAFFREWEVKPLRFEMLGSFPTSGVLQTTPVVTAELLALHAAFHEAVGPATSEADYYYRPGRWNPHCTLALGLSRAELATAYGLVVEGWEPFTVAVARVMLVVPVPTPQVLWEGDLQDF